MLLIGVLVCFFCAKAPLSHKSAAKIQKRCEMASERNVIFSLFASFLAFYAFLLGCLMSEGAWSYPPGNYRLGAG